MEALGRIKTDGSGPCVVDGSIGEAWWSWAAGRLVTWRGDMPRQYTVARRRWVEPFPLTRCSWLYLSKL